MRKAFLFPIYFNLLSSSYEKPTAKILLERDDDKLGSVSSFCCAPKSPPSSSSADATKITLAPSSADINVGENLTLQCHASHDPTMDLTFTWSLDDFPIDLDRSEGHYRRASVVSTKGNYTPTIRAEKPHQPLCLHGGLWSAVFPCCPFSLHRRKLSGTSPSSTPS